MGLVTIDTGEQGFFEEMSFEPIPSGVYVFSLGNLPGTPGIEENKSFSLQTSSTGKPMVPVKLIIEGGPNGEEIPEKGRVVFDNCALSCAFGKQKFAHLAMSMGAMSAEEIKAAGGVDTDRFVPGLFGKAEIGRKSETHKEETNVKNVVKKYLFA